MAYPYDNEQDPYAPRGNAGQLFPPPQFGQNDQGDLGAALMNAGMMSDLQPVQDQSSQKAGSNLGSIASLISLFA